MSDSNIIPMPGAAARKITAEEVARFHDEQSRMRRRAKHEAAAKTLYRVWAYRVGADKPWEHLRSMEMEAWREVAAMVEELADDQIGDRLDDFFTERSPAPPPISPR